MEVAQWVSVSLTLLIMAVVVFACYTESYPSFRCRIGLHKKAVGRTIQRERMIFYIQFCLSCSRYFTPPLGERYAKLLFDGTPDKTPICLCELEEGEDGTE